MVCLPDSVVEKEVIESLETTTGFWNSNIPTWMISPKILTYGKILFDVKERRPSDKNLVNSYCISTSNGCNAFSSDINNTGLYKNLVVDMDNKDDDNIDASLFSIFEGELGRLLSSMEIEQIKEWISTYKNEELIRAALKEAVLSGVGSFRYIDSVLNQWNKKGYKSIEDVLKDKENYRKKNNNIDVFDTDWLND